MEDGQEHKFDEQTKLSEVSQGTLEHVDPNLPKGTK
jgi:hypothetical protein